MHVQSLCADALESGRETLDCSTVLGSSLPPTLPPWVCCLAEERKPSLSGKVDPGCGKEARGSGRWGRK